MGPWLEERTDSARVRLRPVRALWMVDAQRRTRNGTGVEMAGAAAHLADQELVIVVRGGDVEAFACLVDRHHGPLLRHLAWRTGDRELAADLAQEAFLDAFRHLDRLPADRSFAAWLYRIA